MKKEKEANDNIIDEKTKEKELLNFYKFSEIGKTRFMDIINTKQYGTIEKFLDFVNKREIYSTEDVNIIINNLALFPYIEVYEYLNKIDENLVLIDKKNNNE